MWFEHAFIKHRLCGFNTCVQNHLLRLCGFSNMHLKTAALTVIILLVNKNNKRAGSELRVLHLQTKIACLANSV